MKYNQVDTRGRSCPEPVLLTKKAIVQSPEGVQIIADDTTARDNITRFAKNSGYNVETVQQGADYVLTLTR
ncbi:MAG: sulfurtransferase TusA family protein [Tepidanaerobacteraceae bacterium]|nr:sulfurtransferase TusA family protein [Tepidanaerobacteraceae bacterium]